MQRVRCIHADSMREATRYGSGVRDEVKRVGVVGRDFHGPLLSPKPPHCGGLAPDQATIASSYRVRIGNHYYLDFRYEALPPALTSCRLCTTRQHMFR